MQIQKGIISRTQRCVVYGCEGVGKSTFASKFPKALFADLEGGTAQLDISRVEISSWENLLNTIDELSKDAHGFETFIIDSADWAESLCSEYLCKKYKKTGIEEFGYGKGYQYLAEEYAQMLAKLTSLQVSGMNVVLIAHSIIQKLELPEENGTYDHYGLKCSKKVSPLIKEWADGLLFANYRTFVQTNANGKGKAVGGKERVLYTEHTAFCDAKNRWGLTGILPLDFSSLAGIFKAKTVVEAKPTPAKQVEVIEEDDSKTFGNVEITDVRKANLSLLESSMEFGGIKADELTAYLQGNNSQGKAFISLKETYVDVPADVLEKLSTEEAFDKVASQIRARRAK